MTAENLEMHKRLTRLLEKKKSVKLKKPVTLTFELDSMFKKAIFKAGDKVQIDAIKIYHCESGYMARTVGIFDQGRWLDFHWFKELRNCYR